MTLSLAVSVSPIYISLIALLALVLGGVIVRFRISGKVDLGDDGSREMLSAIRAHANLIEWAPIILLLLLVSELLGFNSLFLHIMGVSLVVGRIAHGFGMIKGKGGDHKGRFYGTIITWLVLIILSVANLLAAFGLI